MRGDTSAVDAVFWAAGPFAPLLIVKAEASPAERGNTRVYKPVPDTRPLAVASMDSGDLLNLMNENRSRSKCKAGGEEAAINWGDNIFRQFRQLVLSR
jgi:hypothetical protein